MDARLRRVNKEIAGKYNDESRRSFQPADRSLRKDCKADKQSLITVELVDDSPFHLVGSFPGPVDTPYEGGHYEVVSSFDSAIHDIFKYELDAPLATGYCYSRFVPISARQDEVHNVGVPLPYISPNLRLSMSLEKYITPIYLRHRWALYLLTNIRSSKPGIFRARYAWIS
jgi:hypothetical protein